MTKQALAGGQMLYGVKAIAEFLGIRQRQALGLIERGHLPHYHVGKIVCANRPTLLDWMAKNETAGQKSGGQTDGG